MNSKWFGALAAGALLSLSSAPAFAQQWLADRTLTQGRGIRVGNFELHPGVGAEVGYDSNVFYAPPDATQSSALRIRVTPSLFFSTLGAERTRNSTSNPTALPTVNFRGGAALSYNEWVGLSGSSRVSSLRNLGAEGQIRLEFFPGRTWQFVIADDFIRTIQPGDEIPASGASAPRTFNRNFNTATFELAFAPNRGIFEFRLGYNFIVNIFDSGAYNYNNYMTHQASARMRWRFLPKTALLWEGYFAPMNYIDSSGATTGLFSSYPLRTRFGLNGLLTEKISLLAMVGYHAGFFVGGDNVDTIIGQAELRWIIGPRADLKIGFLRDVQNSFFGNFYIRNRGYLTWSHNFGGRVLVSVDGGVGLHQYGYVANRDGSRTTVGSGFDPVDGSFTAVRVDGTVFSEYRVSNVFGINLTLRGMSNISDVRLGQATGLDGQPGQSIAWTRFEAWLGARVNW